MTLKKKKKKHSKKKSLKPKIKIDPYRIIISSQNKIMVSVFKTICKESAVKTFEKIIKENKKAVRFPIRYSSRDHKLMESKYEILLLRKKTDEDVSDPLLRNEFGQLVKHSNNSNKMVIYKKEEYLMEESFWIYGFNPKSQRKDFNFILNDMLLYGLLKVKYPMKTVYIYRNKLIIEKEDDFDVIICKCENDSIRLYNELEKEINKLKLKSVFFMGIPKGEIVNRIENKLILKTSWTLSKIRRKNTRP